MKIQLNDQMDDKSDIFRSNAEEAENKIRLLQETN